MFFDVLQVFVFFQIIVTNKLAFSLYFSTFLLTLGHTFPSSAESANQEVDYDCINVLFKGLHDGDRIRGNSLMVTILPVLHTGQRQGFIPVSLSKRSTLVSGGFCFLIIVSKSGFPFGTNCKLRFRFNV